MPRRHRRLLDLPPVPREAGEVVDPAVIDEPGPWHDLDVDLPADSFGLPAGPRAGRVGDRDAARSNRTLTFPARFMLAAAMNPCPCGNLGHPKQACHCTPGQVERYRSRISGPLLDRIDLTVEVPALSYDDFTVEEKKAASKTIRERVSRARELQAERLRDYGWTNAAMGPAEIEEFCSCGDDGQRLLKTAMDRYGLSGRSIHRVLKVARTIADLAGSEEIASSHVAEALQYRVQQGADYES